MGWRRRVWGLIEVVLRPRSWGPVLLSRLLRLRHRVTHICEFSSDEEVFWLEKRRGSALPGTNGRVDQSGCRVHAHF